MATTTLFKHRKGNTTVVGAKGAMYHFQGVPGRYWARNKAEHEELMKLAETGEAGIYIDPKEPEIDTDATTPMEQMKRKIIAEFMAEQAKIKDVGEYDASLAAAARAVGGTDENVLTGSALASAKNNAALTGQDSPALAAAKAAAAGKKP